MYAMSACTSPPHSRLLTHWEKALCYKTGDAEEGSASEDDFLGRQDSGSGISASTSETELSGLKQQRQEWEVEKQALLREMGNLR